MIYNPHVVHQLYKYKVIHTGLMSNTDSMELRLRYTLTGFLNPGDSVPGQCLGAGEGSCDLERYSLGRRHHVAVIRGITNEFHQRVERVLAGVSVRNSQQLTEKFQFRMPLSIAMARTRVSKNLRCTWLQ